jgi:hypothetical protein
MIERKTGGTGWSTKIFDIKREEKAENTYPVYPRNVKQMYVVAYIDLRVDRIDETR